MAAENEGEVFEVVDEENNVTGRELRSVVHRTGLLHRAVYCWVFNSKGELLIQRRSHEKKIGPGQWDLSCAEHMQPGETYRQGAQRGLMEELGITAEITDGPLGPTHKRELRVGQDFLDREFVESFALKGYDGPFKCDEVEVMDAKFLPLDEIRRLARDQPDDFTAWFHDEIRLLGWFADSSTLQQDGAVAETSVQVVAAG